jgi:hypothetical protein
MRKNPPPRAASKVACGRRWLVFRRRRDDAEDRGLFPGFSENSLDFGRIEFMKVTTNSFFIIFDDIVEYLSIRYTRLKKQGRRTKTILTVG